MTREEKTKVGGEDIFKKIKETEQSYDELEGIVADFDINLDTLEEEIQEVVQKNVDIHAKLIETSLYLHEDNKQLK